MNEQEAQMLKLWHKEELDFLHELGCKYGISQQDMKRLCSYAHVSYFELQNNVIEPTKH